MICRTCEEREAHLGKHDCDRCLQILRRLDDYAPDMLRAVARRELFPDQPSVSEVFATPIEAGWHFTEIADAIRRRLELWKPEDSALVTLKGIGDLEEAQIKMLGENLGLHVERGTATDSLYITGF